jgi:SAGA-associated factor 73
MATPSKSPVVPGEKSTASSKPGPKKGRPKRKQVDGQEDKPKKRPRKATKVKPPSKRASSPPSNEASTTDTTKRKPRKTKPTVKAKEIRVDVERQCGVPLPNGGFCARSLTCKTHSMGAKRAVQGRSQPYDVLLAAYQKRNQVKMASLSTQAQLELDNEALMDEGPFNEEEEFEQVMAGVVRAYPVPLERKVIMPTRLRTGFFRLREALIGSITNVPPLPTLPSTASTDAQQSVNAVMASTGSVLGRTIVFDTATRAQYARPPRVYINPNAARNQLQLQQKQALLLRQRQLAAMQRAATGGTVEQAGTDGGLTQSQDASPPNLSPSLSGVSMQSQMSAALMQGQVNQTSHHLNQS